MARAGDHPDAKNGQNEEGRSDPLLRTKEARERTGERWGGKSVQRKKKIQLVLLKKRQKEASEIDTSGV